MKLEIPKYLNFIRWIGRDLRPILFGMFIIIGVDVLGALSGVSVAVASKNMVDYAVSGNIRMAAWSASLFAGLVIFSIGMRIMSSLVSVRTQEKYGNLLRQKMFQRLTASEWMQVSKYHSGDLLTRLTSDVGVITNGVVNVFPGMISLGVQLAAAFATLLYFEPILAVLAFLLGPFSVLASRYWGRKLKMIQKRMQEMESAYRSHIQEALQNLMIVKAFRLENQSTERIQQLHDQRMEWVLKRNRISLAATSVLSLGYSGGYVLAFAWGAWRLSNNATTFGTLTAFLQLVEQVQGPFIGLSRSLPQIIAVMASVERLTELETLEMEKSPDKLEIPLSASIIFKNASFAYSDEKRVLEDMSLTIEPGETVGIVGASGEGKTTMIRMILALLKPDSGEVLFKDEYEHLQKATAATREWLAYVPQGNTLFSGTIADNLRLGRPDASEEDMETALKAASAGEFVSELPEGLNTVIGENGLGLSEGQAQRIAIARALIRKVPVLILDEATSALDMDSEKRVLEGIRNLRPSMTCIVITHRPSALDICTRILKLQEGKLEMDMGASSQVA